MRYIMVDVEADGPCPDGYSMFANWYFHRFTGVNPFGHSSMNLDSLYKGLIRNLRQNFKHLRRTRHTHNPLDDAMGNAEAMLQLMQEYGLDTATLPGNWLSRAVRVSTPYMEGAVAVCPCATDLAISKMAAGRDKDMAYVAVMVGEGMTGWEAMRSTILAEMPDGMPRRRLLETLGTMETRHRRGMEGQAEESAGVTP